MRDFPKVRWLAGLLMVTFAVVFEGLDFDLAGALSSPGLRAAGIGAGLLAIGKVIEEVIDEAMRSIDADDPVVRIMDGHIQRGIETPGFWRRVL
jgi:hypothetical protein